MAGVGFSIRTDPIVTGTAAKTILQIVARSQQAVLIDAITIGFNGIANTDAPIRVDIMYQTTAGTMTAGGTNSTIVKDPPDSDETIQTTIRDTATVEPTAGDILRTYYVHPQASLDAPARLISKRIKIPQAGRLGVRVTAAVSVSCVVTATGEE